METFNEFCKRMRTHVDMERAAEGFDDFLAALNAYADAHFGCDYKWRLEQFQIVCGGRCYHAEDAVGEMESKARAWDERKRKMAALEPPLPLIFPMEPGGEKTIHAHERANTGSENAS
jgi:hypothetical protein